MAPTVPVILARRYEEAKVRTDAASAALALAQAERDAAFADLTEARREEYDARVAEQQEEIQLLDDEDFYTSNPDQIPDRPYVLPFGSGYPKWNPRNIENAIYGKDWLANSTALICRRKDQDRTRPTRLIFTSGVEVHDSDKIGSVFMARHDQTNAKLGVYEIVGLVIYGSNGQVARIVGDVPDVKLSQSTYK